MTLRFIKWVGPWLFLGLTTWPFCGEAIELEDPSSFCLVSSVTLINWMLFWDPERDPSFFNWLGSSLNLPTTTRDPFCEAPRFDNGGLMASTCILMTWWDFIPNYGLFLASNVPGPICNGVWAVDGFWGTCTLNGLIGVIWDWEDICSCCRFIKENVFLFVGVMDLCLASVSSEKSSNGFWKYYYSFFPKILGFLGWSSSLMVSAPSDILFFKTAVMPLFCISFRMSSSSFLNCSERGFPSFDYFCFFMLSDWLNLKRSSSCWFF